MCGISARQEYICFCCVNFLGCTEAGDLRCKKEKACLDIIDYLTINSCKKKKWYKEKKWEKMKND